MLKRTLTSCSFLLLFFYQALLCAAPFFSVSSSGSALTATVSLCLNGKGPLTCQAYAVTGNELTIKSLIPNKVYPIAGIKVLTAGISVNLSSNTCTPDPSGYCLFSASSTQSVTIPIASTTLYTITTTAGAHGTVSPSPSVSVPKGNSQMFVATASAGYKVDKWYLDNVLVQTGGVDYTLAAVDAAHVVNVTFTLSTADTYVGMLDGSVYVTGNRGVTWRALTHPAAEYSVNALFATKTGELFAGSANGNVYLSMNQGSSWSVVGGGSINDGPVTSVFYVGTTVYASTQGDAGYPTPGHVWRSVNNQAWTAVRPTVPWLNPVSSIFVKDTDVYIAEGSSIYKSANGGEWTVVPMTQNTETIRSIFLVGEAIYFNTTTDHVYSFENNTLTDLEQGVYSLFVNSDASEILAGTEDGEVFPLVSEEDNDWANVGSSSIESIFSVNYLN